MTTKLTDAQLCALSNAANQRGGMLFPLPGKFTSLIARKVAQGLLSRGLVELTYAQKGDEIWQTTKLGEQLTLAISKAGLEAIGVDPADVAEWVFAAPAPAPKAKTRKEPEDFPKPPRKPVLDAYAGKKNREWPATEPVVKAKRKATVAKAEGGEPRPGSKAAEVVRLLRRARGASIKEIAETMGWQAHTVRGLVAGSLKKKGFVVQAERDETRGTVYRIGHE